MGLARRTCLPVSEGARRLAEQDIRLFGLWVQAFHPSPAQYKPCPRQTGRVRSLPIAPFSPGLSDRIWYGAGNIESARLVEEKGMNLMSCTLVLEATVESLGDIQARQIATFRESYASGHKGAPRVSVSRSILPITTYLDRKHFAGGSIGESVGGNQIGIIDEVKATFGRTYIGEPEQIVTSLERDEGVAALSTSASVSPATWESRMKRNRSTASSP